jgi:hypothetical protein
MQLTLKVDAGDGEFTVTTNLWVITQWERKYKAKASQLAAGIGMEDLAFLAYESAKANGLVVPVVFDDWLRQVRTLEVVENEPARPTAAEPSDTH